MRFTYFNLGEKLHILVFRVYLFRGNIVSVFLQADFVARVEIIQESRLGQLVFKLYNFHPEFSLFCY